MPHSLRPFASHVGTTFLAQVKMELESPQGALHTRTNSRNHEIVRSQKKVSKDHPNRLPKACGVVRDPQIDCEVICEWTLNQMLFQWNLYSHGSSHTIGWNKSTVVSVHSAMVSRFCDKPNSFQMVFKNHPSDHETWSNGCRVGIHPCRLYIHLAFTYFGGLSRVVVSELGRAPPFPPMRVLEMSG